MTIVEVEGGRLNDDAARSYNRARRDGMPAGITSSYRSPAQQAYLYDGWVHRRPGFNFALPPGSSKHETGYSLDLPVGPRQWLVDHGRAYGWRRTNPNEAWHFDYFPDEDSKRSNWDPELTKRFQAVLRQPVDGYFGDATRYALWLIQEAVNGRYPAPVDLQHVIGATDDGIVGPATKAAVIHTVADIQWVLSVRADGDWGNVTQAAVENFLNNNYKTW